MTPFLISHSAESWIVSPYPEEFCLAVFHEKGNAIGEPAERALWLMKSVNQVKVDKCI